MYASIKFSKSKSSSGTEHHQRDHTNYYPPFVEERANLRSTDYMDTNPDHNDVISEIPRFYDNLISLYRIHNKIIT